MPNNEQAPLWENRRTPETRKVERLLGQHFARVEAYRFNSASIRIRVIDPQFEGKSMVEREDMVLPLIRSLPKKTQDDILLLLTLAPSELQGVNRHLLVNLEFEQPIPSRL
jgi:stress-induced morphogen